MAYENMTYEFILNRMMQRVSNDYPNLDNREGSIIFNALAGAAAELAIAYIELDNTRNESFVDTASRDGVLLGCKQMGINTSIFDANAGTHKGVFNVEIAIGSRWNCDVFNYEVTEFLGMEDSYYTYKMVCEMVGTGPNNVTGDLTPITDVPTGLSYAKVIECLIEGENEKSDEEIKDFYYDYINSVRSDGNVAQYYQWCSEYDGIGNAKVFPLWNGKNTVKVSILSSSNKAATEELVAEFQEYIDPGITGMGDGIAPIGAFVTVSTATEVPINVSATVKMKDGYTDTSSISTALNDYFSSISYKKSMVAYMTVGATILSATGVEFVTDLLVNDGTSDIILGAEEIPTLGTVNWTVS